MVQTPAGVLEWWFVYLHHCDERVANAAGHTRDGARKEKDGEAFCWIRELVW
jgi:hypothetical protein